MPTLNATPASVSIRGLVVGDDFDRVCRVMGVDVHTYSFASQVSVGGNKLDLTCGTPTFVDPNTVFDFSIPASITIQLTPGTQYEWDMQWIDDLGKTKTIISGKISTLPQVTEP